MVNLGFFKDHHGHAHKANRGATAPVQGDELAGDGGADVAPMMIHTACFSVIMRS